MTRFSAAAALLLLLLSSTGESSGESSGANKEKRSVLWNIPIWQNGTLFFPPQVYQQTFLPFHQGWPFGLPVTSPVTLPATPPPSVLQDISTDILKSSSCGQASFYSSLRIVGGSAASHGEFPWLVAIMKDSGVSHLCGGSLISASLVLTAAHCFKDYRQSDVRALRVLAGDYNIYDTRDVAHQSRAVTRLIRHKRWNSPSPNFNDVALLKLDRPLQFNAYVQPVCLPSSGESYGALYRSGTYATVAGWGRVHWENPGLQRTPLKIQVPLVDQSTCQASLQPHRISDSMVCAGEGHKSTCLGDSGGPLTVLRNGRWVQVGVVSWGLGCGGYGIYTRVSSFRNWIDANSRP